MTTDLDSRIELEPSRNAEANLKTNAELESLLTAVRDLRALDRDRQATVREIAAERDVLLAENESLRQKFADLTLPLRLWQRFGEGRPCPIQLRSSS